MSTLREAHKIVVADDSPLYRGLLRNTLAHERYSVFFAKDGREALALVAEHRPSVLITDWEMPDLSGIELCGRVHRENEFYTHAILLTSNDGKDQIVEGLAAGANDYLVKPFHAGELLANPAHLENEFVGHVVRCLSLERRRGRAQRPTLFKRVRLPVNATRRACTPQCP